MRTENRSCCRCRRRRAPERRGGRGTSRVGGKPWGLQHDPRWTRGEDPVRLWRQRGQGGGKGGRGGGSAGSRAAVGGRLVRRFSSVFAKWDAKAQWVVWCPQMSCAAPRRCGAHVLRLCPAIRGGQLRLTYFVGECTQGVLASEYLQTDSHPRNDPRGPRSGAVSAVIDTVTYGAWTAVCGGEDGGAAPGPARPGVRRARARRHPRM